MLIKHPKTKRRGANAVEFALVIPVFWMLIMGILEMGRGFMLVHIATHAASSGARAAIVGPDNSTADTYDKLLTDVTARVEVDLQAAGIVLMSGNTNRGVTNIYMNGSSTPIAAGDTTQLNSGDTIRVEVGINYKNNSWVMSWPQYIKPSTTYITGAMTMYRE
jgi:Flp pilus assembly protein TadG